MKKKRILFMASLLGAISVAMGAFAAHSLKGVLSTKSLEVFETGVRYQFLHVFAILAAVLIPSRKEQLPMAFVWSTRWFFIGILLFSGSLFLLSTAEITGLTSLMWIGPLTPIGGLCFIIGWVSMGMGALREF